MNKAYLLIGGNMGNRAAYLSAARDKINKQCGAIVAQSSLYQTAAWGIEAQQPFLNQALKLETGLTPAGLLKDILFIEEAIGRKREVKFGPRIIDIDILLFNQEIINSTELIVPHPEMQNRRFVLVPLTQIAAGEVHPVYQKTIRQLLEECPDPLAVQKLNRRLG